MDAIETIPTDLGTLSIHYDDMAESPFVCWDTLGTIYHWHRRMNLGTRIQSEDELPQGVRLPVFIYQHSGVTLNTTGFGCPWDSGQVGWIVAETEKVCKEYGCKKITPTIRRKVLDVLKCEVETFARYLEGNVYGFILEDEEGEHVDSCWGFIGHLDETIEVMLDHCGAKKVDK